MSWTPGPWHSGHNDQPEPEFIVCETNNGSAAVCYVRKREDAGLIAAAPEMLAVLLKLVNLERVGDHREIELVIEGELPALIAKAKGGAS